MSSVLYKSDTPCRASVRTSYFNEYYKNRCANDNEFYEKEKSRIAEYIKNRKMNDIAFAERLKEDRRRYRQRKKEQKALLNNTNLTN